MSKTIAGRINKLFGTQGGLMISLYANFPSDFSWEEEPLFVDIDSLEVPLWCEDFKRHGVQNAQVRFADFDTERRCEELLGKEFSIRDNQQTEEEDEFYLEDLVGFTVQGTAMKEDGVKMKFRGVVSDYFDSETNPLFEIEIANKEKDFQKKILVPAIEEFIAGIDFEKETMKIVLPEGLLNLEQNN